MLHQPIATMLITTLLSHQQKNSKQFSKWIAFRTRNCSEANAYRQKHGTVPAAMDVTCTCNESQIVRIYLYFYRMFRKTQ